VNPTLHAIARLFFNAGGLGLLALGVLDSSPLVFPLGNDLLVLALCARYRARMPYYVAMATLGSLIGSLITDWLSRKSENGQRKVLSGRSITYLRIQVEKRAGWALAVASLLPPPFPFTPVVAAAAAFRYPRNKLLTVVGVSRLVRFAIEGALAIHYGRWIVQQAQSALLERVLIAIIVASIAGTAAGIYHWMEKGRRPAEHSA
jgi:membrane protein YqaA with SNARE-associated domain